jgi:hypothetical protein
MTYHADAQPGCFGQALTFGERHPECQNCPFARECEPEHAQALARLRDQLGIVVKTPKTVKVKYVAPVITGAISSSDMTLPKKVEELLTRLDRAGVRVTEAFWRGENPFDRRFEFLRITAHLLLRMPQGITREMLMVGLERKLNWSRGTAAAHATQAFQALRALGVAEDLNGRLTIKR